MSMICLVFEQKPDIANALSKQFMCILNHRKKLDFYARKTSKFPIHNTKSHHRLAIACLAAAAIERILEAVW
ncbi:MAG: hypothetical protein LBT90_02635, partial [Holosporaceae bacterium]|nr:hypothetical protein [Holosporaceae bacterium]